MNKEQKKAGLKVAKVLAKIMFYGEWKWETPNERVIQMLMQDAGLSPFKDEDEMIAKTSISDDLYIRAIKEIK